MTKKEKAEKLFPYDSCIDEFTRNLRNGIIDLLREAYVMGCDYEENQVLQLLTDRKREYEQSIHTERDAYDYGYIDAINEMIDLMK